MPDMKTKNKSGLGQGLSALLKDANLQNNKEEGCPSDSGRAVFVQVDHLSSGKFQPRRVFNPAHLQELAESIKHNGVIQPIIVRENPDKGGYEIVAGERRWRAAQLAGLSEVPVIVRNIEDKTALEISIVENVQRSDLSPVEEAEGYKRLLDDFSYTQEDIAVASGKSRSHVANILRLLTLSPKIKVMLDDGSISVGHARVLVNAKDAEYIADKIVELGMSVRETEELVNQCDVVTGGASSKRKTKKSKSKELIELEMNLMQITGYPIKIKEKTGTKGVLEIEYSDSGNLKNIIEKLVEGFYEE